jgi:biopolymer transport protein ExbB
MKINWKTVTVCIGTLFLIALGSQAVAADNWGEVARQVLNEQEQSEAGAQQTEKWLKMDQAELKKELADRQAESKAESAKLDALKAEFLALTKKEQALKKDLENEQSEIDAIEGNVRAIAKEAVSESRDNPITAEDPERTARMEGIVTMRQFPGMSVIEQLTEFFFKEIAERGKIRRRTGTFTGPDGRETTGDIIRVGKFTTYYRMQDGKVGFLLPSATGGKLVAVRGDIGYKNRDQIKDFFNGKTNVAPIDPSATGAAFSKLTESTDLRDWMDQGGVFMWVIFVVASLALLVGIERLITLGTKGKASKKVMDQIRDLAEKGQFQEASAYCKSNSRVPTCRMIDGVMDHAGEGGSLEVLENALQEAILKQMPYLERGMNFLALCGAVAPLLGLLGTVTGMIQTFKVITDVGTGDPAMMADGISVALLTTQFGLIVAVPIMFIHHFFQRKVDKIVGDMQEKGTAFAVTLLKRKGSVEG